MSEVTFKTIQNQETSEVPQVPQAIEPPRDIVLGMPRTPANPTLDEYHQTNQMPVSHELLNTGTPFEYLPGDTQRQLESIDKFVEMEITQKHLANTVGNYKMILGQLESEMINGEEPVGLKISQLAAYAENMLKLDGLEDIQKNLKSKLKRMNRKKDMDNLVLKEIGRIIL